MINLGESNSSSNSDTSNPTNISIPLHVLTLKRIGTNPESTFGLLMEDGVPFIVTVELPWKQNKIDESCIPTGEYLVKMIDSPSHGRVYGVQNVPNRDHILIHRGNTTGEINGTIQSHGCILVGMNYGYCFDRWGIQQSSVAYDYFMKRMNYKDFKLVILNV